MFNFTVAKIQESFQQSLDNLQLPYVDLIQVHDCEFSGSIDQIVKKVLPTLLEFKKEGKARYIGITSYNLGVLKKIVKLAEPGTIDTVLTYGRCNLVNQGMISVNSRTDFFFVKLIAWNGFRILQGNQLRLMLLFGILFCFATYILSLLKRVFCVLVRFAWQLS